MFSKLISFFYLCIFYLPNNINIVTATSVNGTGGNFPGSIYNQITFAYLFEKSADSDVSYVPVGATGGKCNIMGYWHTSNAGSALATGTLVRDTLICTDKCTVATCGNDSSKYPRFDKRSRIPLVDFGVLTSTLSANDRKAFPDLHVFPSVAGAVVPIYNIPELVNISSPLILSRATIAAIFRGSIKKWNDYRIVNDNVGIVKSIIASLNKSINLIVRTDSSGITEIFVAALASFDPSGLSTPDNSFSTLVGTGTTPKWCGALTDEIQVLTIDHCSPLQSIEARTVNLGMVGLDRNLYNVHFDCLSSATLIKTEFEKVYGANNILITKTNVTTSNNNYSMTVSIGYWGNVLAKKNWYEPSLISSTGTAITTTINTLQEGGLLNSHFNSTYKVTIEVQSIWINIHYNASFAISLISGGTKSTFINPNNNYNTLANTILSAMNQIAPGIIKTVKYTPHSSTSWIEMVVTFSGTTYLNPTPLIITTANSSLANQVLVTTSLNGKNYPLFYDNTHPLGATGSGRYTCYRHEDNMVPWTYYAGTENGGVLAQIRWLNYAIAYNLVEDTKKLNLQLVSLKNRAGNIVVANAGSVALALMEKGGNFDQYFYATLVDCASSYCWPITGYSYFIIRTNAHVGNCNRRRSAMKFLYDFYMSDTDYKIASRLDMAALPQYIRSVVLTELVNTAKCSTGEYALSQYRQSYSYLLAPQAMSSPINTYISVYNSIDSTFAWDYLSDEVSNNLWSKYIASPDSYIGLMTLFPSSTVKKAYYSSLSENNALTITAFTHIAVVPIYHLNAFTASANSPLRLTADILAGVYSGKILYWNDSLIQQANYNNRKYLPATRIQVVYRSIKTDINSLLSRYLGKVSTLFNSTYHIPEDIGLSRLPFESVLPPDSSFAVATNGDVDASVALKDASLGYYSLVGTPISLVALFCRDSNCLNVINPSLPASISACQSDNSTLLQISNEIITYDLMNSAAIGCYPITGTVDYITYSVANAPSCAVDFSGLANKRAKFSAWLFEGSSVVKSLTILSMAGSSSAVRTIGYNNICNIQCDNTYIGYEVCNYRNCLWSSGDFEQIVSSCQSSTQTRIVSYQKKTSADCILNTDAESLDSINIECDYTAFYSTIGIICQLLVFLGLGFLLTILFFFWMRRNEKLIKWAQPIFVYLSVMGALLMHVCIITFLGENTKTACTVRPVLLSISTTLMLAPLLMKLHRVDRLFNNRKLKRIVISNGRVIQEVLALCMVDVVILVLWMSIDTPGPEVVTETYTGLHDKVENVTCSNNSIIFGIILIVYKLCLLLFGVMKAISTWKIVSEISEAKYFAVAIYNITVIGGIVMFLVLFVSFRPEAITIMKAIGLFLCANISQGIVIISRLTMKINVIGGDEDHAEGGGGTGSDEEKLKRGLTSSEKKRYTNDEVESMANSSPWHGKGKMYLDKSSKSDYSVDHPILPTKVPWLNTVTLRTPSSEKLTSSFQPLSEAKEVGSGPLKGRIVSARILNMENHQGHPTVHPLGQGHDLVTTIVGSRLSSCKMRDYSELDSKNEI